MNVDWKLLKSAALKSFLLVCGMLAIIYGIAGLIWLLVYAPVWLFTIMLVLIVFGIITTLLYFFPEEIE